MRVMLENIKDNVVQIDGIKVHDGKPTLKDLSTQKYVEFQNDPRKARTKYYKNHHDEVDGQTNSYLDDIYVHNANKQKAVTGGQNTIAGSSPRSGNGND